VIAVAILVSAIMLIYVVPQFEGVLQELWRRPAGLHPDDRATHSEFMVKPIGG
jgi:hypothetical protein